MTSPYTKDKPETIAALFNTIAPRYDLANTLMSMGFHYRWNRSLIKMLQGTPPHRYLDLCCGTGAIALNYLEQQTQTPCHAYLIDFSEGMLKLAEQRWKKKEHSLHEVELIRGDAMEISLPDHSVDTVTIAYGIRNVASPQRVIQEIYRVLKPGGIAGILELTRPKNSLLATLHSFYLKTALPVIGRLLTRDANAYRYLKESVHEFIPPEALNALSLKAGFSSVITKPLLFGIATRLILRK